MPIVFEEITGEIAPERRSDTAGVSEATSQHKPVDLTEELRRELMLLHERSARLKAD